MGTPISNNRNPNITNFDCQNNNLKKQPKKTKEKKIKEKNPGPLL